MAHISCNAYYVSSGPKHRQGLFEIGEGEPAGHLADQGEGRAPSHVQVVQGRPTDPPQPRVRHREEGIPGRRCRFTYHITDTGADLLLSLLMVTIRSCKDPAHDKTLKRLIHSFICPQRHDNFSDERRGHVHPRRREPKRH